MASPRCTCKMVVLKNAEVVVVDGLAHGTEWCGPDPTFSKEELVAIRHALSGTPPSHLYAGWMTAARRVKEIIDGHP